MKDPILKKIFATPAMIELLARRYRSDLASRIDFSTLRELPNELLSEQLDRRVADLFFLANCRGDDRRVLFHIEFQAASDTEMPLRSLVYASLAVQKLRKHYRRLGESGALVVVSMVLYHGAGPWKAPTTAEELVPGLAEYVLVRPEAIDPDAACAEHVPAMVLGLLVPGQTPAELRRRLDSLARALEQGTDPQLRVSGDNQDEGVATIKVRPGVARLRVRKDGRLGRRGQGGEGPGRWQVVRRSGAASVASRTRAPDCGGLRCGRRDRSPGRLHGASDGPRALPSADSSWGPRRASRAARRR